MGDWKYIMFDRNTPVLFPDSCSHAEIAAALKHLGQPTSAGFVTFGQKKHSVWGFRCYGKSESLQLESKSDDEHWINCLLT